MIEEIGLAHLDKGIIIIYMIYIYLYSKPIIWWSLLVQILNKHVPDERMKEHDKSGEKDPLGMMGAQGNLDRGVG